MVMNGGENMALTENPPRTGLDKVIRERGLKYPEIATEVKRQTGVGISAQAVGQWARGEKAPRNPEVRKAMSVLLGVDIYTLFFRHEDDPDFLMPTG